MSAIFRRLSIGTSAAIPIVSDTYYNKVSLLVRGEGYNGSTAIFDESPTPKVITVNGNTAVVSNPPNDYTSKKYGSGALYFDGSGDYLTFPQISCTGNFTVESCINRSSVESNTVFIAKSGGAGWIGWNSNTVFYYEDATGTVNGTFTIPNTTNVWGHYAIVRNNNIISVYVNGVAASSTITDSSTYIVKQLNGLDVGFFFTGYVCDLRITNGVARYTANFTPPTTTFPTTDGSTDTYRSNVSLLLKGEAYDKSIVPKWPTINGSASLAPLSGLDATGSAYKARLYFNGAAGDYYFSDVGLSLKTGDWTVECSFYVASNFLTNSDVFSFDNQGGANQYASLKVTITNNSMYILVSADGSSWMDVNTTSVFSGLMYRMAFVRSGNTFSAYVNGNRVASYTVLSFVGNGSSNSNLRIGTLYSPNKSYFNGYVDNFRVTKGIARYSGTSYTVTDPVIGTSDPYWYYVSLLIANSYADYSPTEKAITWNGNVKVSNTQNKWGSGALYFDGSGDYLIASNANLSLSADFTIEFWMNANSTSGANPMIIGSGATSWGVGACGICIQASTGNVAFFTYASNGTPIVATSAISTGQWVHIALVRSGTTVSIYKNGILAQSATNAETLYSPSATYIGFNGWDSPTGNQFNGYIDDLRITKGIARYTATFTPPGPLPIS